MLYCDPCMGKRLAPRPPHRAIVKMQMPCRFYMGPRNDRGYGRRRHSTPQLVHRWVWEQVHGPIAPGIFILHKCDNEMCFRYDHLFAGTKADNAADAIAKGRR